MKIFSKLYDKMLRWSSHRHADYYLVGVSVAESSFFPVPPDVMLAPMIMAKPLQAWRLAFMTTLFSVVGGILGYFIGFLAFDTIGQPIVNFLNLQEHYQHVVYGFSKWGVWIILLAGVTPIPYKLFTIAAGVSHMALAPFVVASIFGRALRFFLVAFLIRRFGPLFERYGLKILDKFAWWLIALAILAYLLLKI